jgi:hypothetical protein
MEIEMQNERGRSFIAIMILIAISALAIRIAAERIIEFTTMQNESSASRTLKSISVALENFARENKGAYPVNFTLLTQSKPAYLDTNYIAISPLKGYIYNCPKLEQSGYICNAVPSNCRLTGKTEYTISTGSLFFSEDCGKKE